MGPKSSNLFHFTKSIDYLKGLLLEGFKPRYSLEDTLYLGVDYFAFPMTCFCDIPISRISEHTAFYGEYGVGMTKEWGLKNRLVPLIYTPPSGPVVDLANYLLKLESKSPPGSPHKLYEDLNEHFGKLIPLIKPISGNMLIGGSIIKKDFYQENEWRFVPEDCEFIDQDDYNKNRVKKNADVESKKLEFAPTDMKYMFVKSDTEIPMIFDFIQNNFGAWPLNETKILVSRIISLETVGKDL